MADFETAVAVILQQEGGFCVDVGGATNYGITIPVLKEAAKNLAGLDIDGSGDYDANDIKRLTVEAAKKIYRIQWWDRYKYILIRDQDIATRVFSFSVNMGPKQAHKIIQRALRGVGLLIKDDGWIGPLTIHSLNSVDPKQYVPALRCEAAGYYRGLVMVNPGKYGIYLNGWLNRAYY